MDLKRLIYVSRKAPSLDLEGTIDLITHAAEKNARVGLTGFILFAPKFFLQVLEGDEGPVDETFGRIRDDPRHSDLEVLSESSVHGRSFAQWSMGFASGDESRKQRLAAAGIDDATELPQLDAAQALELLQDLAGGG